MIFYEYTKTIPQFRQQAKVWRRTCANFHDLVCYGLTWSLVYQREGEQTNMKTKVYSLGCANPGIATHAHCLLSCNRAMGNRQAINFHALRSMSSDPSSGPSHGSLSPPSLTFSHSLSVLTYP